AGTSAGGPAATAPVGGPAGGPTGGPAGSAPVPPVPTASPSPSPTAIPKVSVKIGISPSLGGWIVDVAEAQGFLANQGIVLDRKKQDPGASAAAEDVDKRDRDVAVVATDRLVQ